MEPCPSSILKAAPTREWEDKDGVSKDEQKCLARRACLGAAAPANESTAKTGGGGWPRAPCPSSILRAAPTREREDKEDVHKDKQAPCASRILGAAAPWNVRTARARGWPRVPCPSRIRQAWPPGASRRATEGCSLPQGYPKGPANESCQGWAEGARMQG